MVIEFSEHAREQNLRRKIPEKWIIRTVREPEEIKQSFRGRKLRRRRFKDKILEVVTTTEGSKITVITQYWLKEELT